MPSVSYLGQRVDHLETRLNELTNKVHAIELEATRSLSSIADEARDERKENFNEIIGMLDRHMTDMRQRMNVLEGNKQYTLGQYAAVGGTFTIAMAVANLLSGFFF